MIEHRHRARYSLGKGVSIFHRGIFVAECRVKDISMEGMSIWSGPIQYHRNTLLDVEFVLDRKTNHKKFKQQALVVHSSLDALGLMFADMDGKTRQVFSLMLDNAAKVKQTSSDIEQTGSWDNKNLLTQTG